MANERMFVMKIISPTCVVRLIYRVRTGHGKPGKSWNSSISVSRPGKSWNLIVGHGKSWKILACLVRKLLQVS